MPKYITTLYCTILEQFKTVHEINKIIPLFSDLKIFVRKKNALRSLQVIDDKENFFRA